MITGSKLNRDWAVGAKHALFRRSGDWYHRLKEFPGALFDANGYVLFKSEKEFLSSSHLQIKSDVHVPQGISNIPNYVRMTKSEEILENEQSTFFEGTVREIKFNRYERNRKLRKKCIEHYGVTCQVCGINFEKIYGSVARGLIQVHHLTLISKRGGKHEVDAVRDLRPVCPNCHAVIHRKIPPFTIEEVRIFLNRQ